MEECGSNTDEEGISSQGGGEEEDGVCKRDVIKDSLFPQRLPSSFILHFAHCFVLTRFNIEMEESVEEGIKDHREE